MDEKLREIVARYDELERVSALPETYADPERCSALAREMKGLAPAADAAREYFAALEAMREAESFFRDAEFGEMAREEHAAAAAKAQELKARLRELLSLDGRVTRSRDGHSLRYRLGD